MDIFFTKERLSDEVEFDDLIQDEKACLNSSIYIPHSSLEVGVTHKFLTPAVYDPNLKSVLIGYNRKTFIKILSGSGTLESFNTFLDGFIIYKDLSPLFEQAYETLKTDEECSKLVGKYGGDPTLNFPPIH
ncbi:hypothetical protein BGZ76_011157 [Entomortierella beljakovae]|nr:hypothetical protein BGZ76_011157 [Entomortierella beljakovae]